LTADPEKFKQQSPVTNKSNIVEKGRVVVCTRQNRQLSRFSKSSSLPPFLSGVCHYRLCVGLLHHSHTPSPRWLTDLKHVHSPRCLNTLSSDWHALDVSNEEAVWQVQCQFIFLFYLMFAWCIG